MIRFRVTRTSNEYSLYNVLNQPCDEAIKYGDGPWVVLIEDLEALVKFVRKYGDSVLSVSEEGDCFLEIYDDQREPPRGNTNA